MNASAQQTIDPEKQAEKDAKRDAEKRHNIRHSRFRFQASRAIVVADHQFGNGGHDIVSRMVCGSYDDVLEYGRMYYGTEDVVLLDQWGHVIKDAEGKRFFANPPMHMAEGKHVNEQGYVEYPHRAFDVQTVRVATFRKLDVPCCGPCKRKGEGKYVTGPEGDGVRFEIERSGNRGSFGGVTWELKDTKTGMKRPYNSRKKDAMTAANTILRTEFCAQEVASGFTPPELW